MARKRRSVAEEEEEVEGFMMTPMIDIVFQLIIFFMLIMDMSQVQVENVTLPTASKAIKEKYTDKTILIMNILKDGTVKMGGKTIWKPSAKDDNSNIENIFELRRSMRKYQEMPGNDNWVNYPLVIRADRSAEFQHLQKIIMIATQRGGVTKLQLGAKMTTGKSK